MASIQIELMLKCVLLLCFVVMSHSDQPTSEDSTQKVQLDVSEGGEQDKQADIQIEDIISKVLQDSGGSIDSVGDENTLATDDSNTEPTIESESIFFSLKGILKKVIQPMLDEFNSGKTVQEEVRNKETDFEITSEPSEAPPQPTLQLEIPVVTNTTEETITPSEVKTANETAKKLKFQCYGKNVTENSTASVRLVNSTELLHILSFKTNESVSDCVLVMFFAPWCHFSAQTAPHFNALGRAYPNLDVLAVDAAHFSNLNARFGTVSVPNILLFHVSRAVVKFNQTTRSFEKFVQFVKNLTGLDPNNSVVLDEMDYLGPLSSEPTDETDYLLWLAWLFVCVCTTYMVTVSSSGQHVINKVKILWQEHQHIE